MKKTAIIYGEAKSGIQRKAIEMFGENAVFS